MEEKIINFVDNIIYKSNTKNILIMSGGGIKGIAHIGVLCALEELNYLQNIKIFVGVSIGAIVMAIYLFGYSPNEIYELIKEINFDKINNGNIENILCSYGYNTDNKIIEILKKILNAKNINENITMYELYLLTKKKFIISTTCVNTCKTHYIDYISEPNIPVIIAVAMSSCLPILFCPIKYKNKYYIDGGCTDNYPIHLFKHNLDQVIGIYLNDDTNEVKKIDDFENYLFRVVECLINGVIHKSTIDYEKHTVKLLLKKNSVYEFNISDELKQEYFNTGYNSIIQQELSR